MARFRFNSFNTGTSLQAQDGGRPKSSVITAKFPLPFGIVIDFNPAASAFFVRVARPEGKMGVFVEFGQCQLPLRFLRGGSEFPLSLKDELRHSHIIMLSYSNFLGIRGLTSSYT
ncbi:hypothetical protein AVEN_106543-1 [Araneus ventricosus]|uniref:Uncharacterized protein n=1 Tax=Araneus ventricosus TaxID=182803 RepID=A0A4Y2P698_ARAVE|nr:hypothetical protein AVEN_108062-1 [Araneus ventricosus]GBN47438.1 hypothetical protein AVEN_106543-1 [Araneus ventricosus]